MPSSERAEVRDELEPSGSDDVDRKLQKLDAFLVHNEELEELNASLQRFNLLSVLGIERAEIRHSNILAWLLTPGESHGLGDALLRRLMSRLLLENEFDGVNLTPARVELMEFRDVEVLREWQNIDLTVRPGNGEWCLLIENKVGSSESHGQLRRYFERVRADMPEADVLPVLLTLRGEEPSEDGKELGYVSLAYSTVVEIADRIVEQRRSRVPPDALVLIDHYLETLRRLTLQDDKLADLCKAIYRKHRAAIELINEYGASSQVLDACEEEVQDSIPSHLVLSSGKRVFFYPKSMPLWEVDELRGWKQLERNFPIIWWFALTRNKTKLQVSLEVGPIADADLRVQLLTAIESAGLSFSKGAFDPGRKYTRVLTMTKPLRKNSDGEVDDDIDSVREVARAVWAKASGTCDLIAPILDRFRNGMSD